MPDGPLLARVRSFAGDALRDCWVIDLEGETLLYIRDDVAERVEAFDPGPYIDNERYGFITRDVYEDLSYAHYQYTVRGFDEFEQFRTFPGAEPVGVLVSVDRTGERYDFGALYDAIEAVVDDRSYPAVVADETEPIR